MMDIEELGYYGLLRVACNLNIELDDVLPDYQSFRVDYPHATIEDYREYVEEILLDLISDYPEELIEISLNFL